MTTEDTCYISVVQALDNETMYCAYWDFDIDGESLFCLLPILISMPVTVFLPTLIMMSA